MARPFRSVRRPRRRDAGDRVTLPAQHVRFRGPTRVARKALRFDQRVGIRVEFEHAVVGPRRRERVGRDRDQVVLDQETADRDDDVDDPAAAFVDREVADGAEFFAVARRDRVPEPITRLCAASRCSPRARRAERCRHDREAQTRQEQRSYHVRSHHAFEHRAQRRRVQADGPTRVTRRTICARVGANPPVSNPHPGVI